MKKLIALFLAVSLGAAQAQVANTIGPSGQVTGGQTPGTTTNDNAAAGNVGQIIQSTCPSAATTATVTISQASPGVVTWTTHGFTTACPVVFTTTGSLPAAITSGTVYYVIPSSITTNTFSVATSLPNALAGTGINTATASTPTTTGTAGAAEATTVTMGMTGITLTPGDWDCRGVLVRGLAATTSVTLLKTTINTSVADGSLQSGTMVQFSTAANVMAADNAREIGPVRVSVAANTGVYLVGTDTFTANTNKTYGNLICRRVR